MESTAPLLPNPPAAETQVGNVQVPGIPLHPHIPETQAGNTVPPVALMPLTPPKQTHVQSTALLAEGSQAGTAALCVPSSTRSAQTTQ